MCCDGTLFLRAVLDEDERDRFASSGLDYVEQDNRLYFSLPCPKLCGTACSIYGARPKVCGRFRCKILRRVETGSVMIGEAAGHVETALALRAKADATMPGARLNSIRQAARQECADRLSDEFGTGKAEAAARLLPMIALDEYLARWFRGKGDQDPATDDRD